MKEKNSNNGVVVCEKEGRKEERKERKKNKRRLFHAFVGVLLPSSFAFAGIVCGLLTTTTSSFCLLHFLHCSRCIDAQGANAADGGGF